MLSYDIVDYLSSMVAECFALVIGESPLSAIDLVVEYRKFSEEVQRRLNEQAEGAWHTVQQCAG